MTDLELKRETITAFGNAFHAMQNHLGNCEQCCEYLYEGDGDLCGHGKEIIFNELVYADTGIKYPKEWRCYLGNGRWDHDWVEKHDSSGEVDGGPGDHWSWRECRVCGATEMPNTELRDRRDNPKP